MKYEVTGGQLLPSNNKHIKTSGIAALFFLRHYRHQVALELYHKNHVLCCPSAFVCFLFFFQLGSRSVFLFPLFNKMLLTLHFRLLPSFCPCTFPSLVLSLNYFLLLLPSPNSFILPFLSCSPDSGHALFVKKRR